MNRTRKHIETLVAEAAGADRDSIESKVLALQEVRDVLNNAADQCYASDDWLVSDLQELADLARDGHKKAEQWLENFKDEDAINDADDKEYADQQRDYSGML